MPRRCAPLLVSVALLATVAVGDEKANVPTSVHLTQSLANVRSIFGDKYAQARAIRSPTERDEALTKLVDEILETYDSTIQSADRYALLQVARQIAVYQGDFETALATIDTAASRFHIDALNMKASMLTKASGSLASTGEHAAIVPFILSVLDETTVVGRGELSKSLFKAAIASAARARDRKLVVELQKQAAEFAAYEQAVSTLEQSPADPDANLKAGKYLCVVRGDWASGLSNLALGADEQLQRVAVADLTETETPTEVAKQLEIAELWWKIADGAEDVEQKAFRNRAKMWYEKVLPELPQQGLTYKRIKSRLEEASADAGDSDAGSKLASTFVGKYIYDATGKKPGNSVYAVWEFRDDEVLENSVPIAKWTVSDRNRIKIELNDGTSEPMLFAPSRGKSATGSREADGDTWRWRLDRLEAKTWEHKTESVKVFGREIDGGTENLTFYSNGRINDPLGSITWRLQGNKIGIDWGDRKSTEATIGAGGTTYAGATWQPTGFGRTRLKLPVTGRLISAGD